MGATAVAALAFVAGVARPGPGAAAIPRPAVRSWVVENFHAEIRVRRSGTVDVEERISVRFDGSFNGIFRTIPVEYDGPGGFNYTLRLDVRSVTDRAGNELRHELDRDGRYRKIQIWVPGARDATRTVVIRYRIDNGLRFFEENGIEWDELYWNVTGAEWPVPIERASARVSLPPVVTGTRALAFTGPYGATEQNAEVAVRGHVIEVASRRPLDFREGLTVAVAWDSRVQAAAANASPGEYVIRRPTLLDGAGRFLMANSILLAPVLVFLIVYQRWRSKGRDPGRHPIVARYEPPMGLTPSEVGVLVDHRADMRDITAALVHLAVRGFLRIEKKEEEAFFGLVSHSEYGFTLTREWAEWDGLQRHERQLLNALFDRGERRHVTISELENSFHKSLSGIKDGIYDALVEKRYYLRRPDKIVTVYIVAALFTGAAVLAAGMALSGTLGTSPLAAVVAAGISALVVGGFGLFMPARTIAGARVMEEALGFEEFLGRVESDRYRRTITDPSLFEKYLPYAMALGVEKKWAGAFEDIYTQAPQWYVGGDVTTFHAAALTSDLSRMSSRTASAMTSSPRGSSGGSGFGGGGFSGGGFGGGGGGAF